MSTPIFIDNPGILVDKNHIFDFIPDIKASTEERINAIVRFSLYFSIVLMIFKNNYRYSYIFVATLIISYFFYDTNRENFTSNNNAETTSDNNNNNNSLFCKDKEEMENNVNINCDEPKCDNLFMNVLPTDDFSKKKPACSYTKEISRKVNNGFYNKFKKDVNTFYNQDFGMRQFYSMPNTQVPNDQGTFAKWLYNTPVSCSVGSSTVLNQNRSCNMNHATLEDLQDNSGDKFLCLSKDYQEVS
tara:strand:+ start:135 stop:866 length:732 start_codon:yes stop_codon:yes gene_type:complete